MQNPYSLSCYILVCNQLHLHTDLTQLLCTVIIMYCKSPVLEPSLILHLSISNVFLEFFLILKSMFLQLVLDDSFYLATLC